MSVKGEAVKRLVNVAGDVAGAVARNVDDWGWKGGKPGELTGTMYDEIVAGNPGEAAQAWLSSQFGTGVTSSGAPRFTRYDLDAAAKNQLAKLAHKNDSIHHTIMGAGVNAIMDDFRILEEAGIPRRWTGKIEAALPVEEWGRYPFSDVGRYLDGNAHARWWRSVDSDVVAGELSDTMRDLGDDHLREAFVRMLPRWNGQLEELGDFVREAGTMPRLTREYLLQNASKMFEMNLPREAIFKTALAMMQGK